MARRKAKSDHDKIHDKIHDGVQKMCEDIVERLFIIGECLKKCIFVIGNGQELTQYKWDVSLREEFKKFITSSSISCIVYLAKKIHNCCCLGITFKDLKIDNFNKDYTFNVHFKDLRVARYNENNGKVILCFYIYFFDNITADEEKIAKGDIKWENIIHQCGLDQVINQRVWKILILDAIIFHHLNRSFDDSHFPNPKLEFSDVVDITRTFIFMNQTNKKIIEENEITKLFEKVYDCFSTMSSVKQ
ncbi:hypothetical protein [Segatella asaccharophila]